jgi:HK97 gp10 family phage protein
MSIPLVEIEIHGFDEVMAHLDSVKGKLEVPKEPMVEAALIVAISARRKAPVDTRRLQSSIMPSIRRFGNEVMGVVGSNVKYAPFMELGTKPHFPPLQALEAWAERHGTTAYVVARAISRRGLKPRRYLQKAVEENTRKVVRLIGHFVAKIIR